jgi:hypothetical protein
MDLGFKASLEFLIANSDHPDRAHEALKEQGLTYCSYCSETAESWDHVLPQALGGKNTYNLVPCCFECNNQKANKSFLEWLLWLAAHEERERFLLSSEGLARLKRKLERGRN